MGLGQDFFSELHAWGLGGSPANSQVAVASGAVQVGADVVTVDRLGCELRLLRGNRTDAVSLDIDTLKQKGAELCRRVTYLLEPLQVVEVDSQATTVQARSQPPDRQSDRIRYYELQLNSPATLQLFRFEKRGQVPRTRINLHLTFEQVEKLVEDLGKVLTP